MKAAKPRFTYQSLAARTKEVDPEGRGISWQLVAFLASARAWARDTTSARTVDLITQALDRPEDELFAAPAIAMPDDSTETGDLVNVA